MAITPDFQASLDAIDNATNKAGASVTAIGSVADKVSIKFDALKALISTSMSPADVATVKATIDAETTKLDNASLAADAVAAALNGIAADPAEVVPTPVPEPIPVM